MYRVPKQGGVKKNSSVQRTVGLVRWLINVKPASEVMRRRCTVEHGNGSTRSGVGTLSPASRASPSCGDRDSKCGGAVRSDFWVVRLRLIVIVGFLMTLGRAHIEQPSPADSFRFALIKCHYAVISYVN